MNFSFPQVSFLSFLGFWHRNQITHKSTFHIVQQMSPDHNKKRRTPVRYAKAHLLTARFFLFNAGGLLNADQRFISLRKIADII